MPDRKLPPLTAEQLKEHLLDHGVTGTANLYGVSRQRIYQLVERHDLTEYAGVHYRRQMAATRQNYRATQAALAAERQAKKAARPRPYVPGLIPPQNTTADHDVSITLSNGNVCWISGEDADLALRKWVNNNGYACARITAEYGPIVNILMHRLVLSRVLGAPVPDDLDVDHIDGDRLNNRRSNLRPATRSLNQANRKVSISNTSGYKGVTWVKKERRWAAVVANRRVGSFVTAEEAARAYDKAAVEMYGEYALTNAKMGLL